METIMIRYALLSLAVASVAFAQAVAVEKAPVIRADHKLACPVGTRQVGGLKSNLQLVACMKLGAEGERQFHGPMISLYPNGKVEAVGQVEEGFRTGKWTFFDEQGVKTGEAEFLKGDFNGRRAFFNPDGSLKAEENWVKGLRQGPQKTFLNGVATVTEYKDDRPVQK
jgi:hypothetical protein